MTAKRFRNEPRGQGHLVRCTVLSFNLILHHSYEVLKGKVCPGVDEQELLGESRHKAILQPVPV
eukprot:CAMPEP_0203924606 /NCGR_PEP_ID=MMETSP0359-20131031/64345_1 /ASSEMBLY_ACC=CAM_ASM_000338 /TAXON_ID=268821 /ORGANISM="Scrippsiella Hangoei, Strain SHTV-5" /LENGTH=63 /DNA_ID=CAMNT_0050852867 /DNA_START=21 /DNA_END=212 /DNA_ORIENTATION=-